MLLTLLSVALAAPLPSHGYKPPVLPENSDLFVVTTTDRGSMTVEKVSTVPAGYVAAAHWKDAVSTTGWAYLQMTTSPSHDDAAAAYAAGFLEGFVTAEMIWNFYYTSAHSGGTSPYDEPTMAFLQKGEDWIHAQASANNKTDPYWYMTGLVYVQMEGMVAGYNTVVEKNPESMPKGATKLTLWDFQKSNFDEGDVYDIACLVNISSCATTHPSMAREMLLARLGKAPEKLGMRNRVTDKAARGHCTAAVKVAPDNADIFIGHTTWDDLENMYRIWKVYDLPFRATPDASDASPRATNVGMSSYPMSLASSDDFVFNGHGLAAVSSEIFPPCPNADVWKGITPQGLVWEWVRNVVAMRIATSAPDWAKVYGTHQSSTYNNEWIVVDYKKFTPGQPLKPDTIWLVDQMPQLYTAYDLTANITKRDGQWFGSWNTQADPHQYELCGWPEYIADTAKEFGEDVANDYSWCCQTRAKMMGREQAKVQTLADFGNMMRYNNYKSDDLSKCDQCQAEPTTPCKAISTRCDLAPMKDMGHHNFWGGACFGGYDSKVLNSELIGRMSAWAQSGPTHDDLPPFSFSTKDSPCAGIVHPGLPDLWNFTWVEARHTPVSEAVTEIVV